MNEKEEKALMNLQQVVNDFNFALEQARNCIGLQLLFVVRNHTSNTKCTDLTQITLVQVTKTVSTPFTFRE